MGFGSKKEIIFNTFKIKYDLLNTAFENKGVKVDSNFSIYIDMNDLLKTFYKKEIVDEDPIDTNNYMNVTAYILNMLIHYRRYVSKVHKRESKIYIIYRANSDVQNATEFILLRNCMNTNMKLIKELCPFIPGVYFIDSTDYHNNNCIVQFLINHEPTRFHWVISRSVVDVQSLCALGGRAVDNILVTILKYDRRMRTNTSIILYRGSIFKELMNVYGYRGSDRLIKKCDYIDSTDDIGLIPMIELFAHSSYMYKRTFSKIIDTVYKNRKDLYLGQVVDIANYEIVKLLYSEDELKSLSGEFSFERYINQAYLLVNSRLTTALFNREDEHCVLSKIYDLKNRSLNEINDLEYMDKNLFVDVEDLIKGGDIDGSIKPNKKVKW
ncbi:MAG: hypothetical protein ACRC0G_07695 [Fusobacteriaceae bacterium]